MVVSICCTRVVLGIRGAVAYFAFNESSGDGIIREENQLFALSETRQWVIASGQISST